MNIITSDIYDNFNPLPLDLRGWNSNNSIFEELIFQVKPQTIIEVGTWKGASAINMGHIIKKLNLNCKIYCIDTWLGALEFWTNLKFTEERNLLLKNGYPQIYYQFLSNVMHNNLQDIILPLPLPSSVAYKVLEEQQIIADLIYIDGSHEYEDVAQDIKNYMKLLSNVGIIFGDDYPVWPGVKQAVEEYFNYNFENKNGFWVHSKTKQYD